MKDLNCIRDTVFHEFEIGCFVRLASGNISRFIIYKLMVKIKPKFT